jgi:hypothetical protein
MTYKLMVSRDCGIHYNVAYETEDRNDPILSTKMEEAAAKVLRFYLEGDSDVLCPLHAHAVELLGGPVLRGPYATTSMQDKVSRLTRAWKG